MKITHKILRTCLLLVLVIGLLAPAIKISVPPLPKMSTAVADWIEEHPDQIMRVIVQVVEDPVPALQYVEDGGGTVLRRLPLINAFSAELNPQIVFQLARFPSVRWVSLDAPVLSTARKVKDSETFNEALPANYFLETLGVPLVWDMGFQGQGVAVAVIDSGIFTDRDFSVTPNKPHTRIQIEQSFNSESSSDQYGHGTHVAGIIGGNGGASGGLYPGIAPKVDLINLKISNDLGLAYESDSVAALQWVYDNKETYNIRVVNLSIQSTVPQSYHESALDAAAEILWFNGVVVVAAAGNSQEENGFNSIEAAPGNDPFIITVGAVDQNGTPSRADDKITSFTSRGKTLDGYTKPDIFAPGVDIISVLSHASDWRFAYPNRVLLDGEYFRLSGTSMAAPMVAGAAALLLQSEPDLTPDQVKYRLLNKAGTIGAAPYLDVYAALSSSTDEPANQGNLPHMLLAKMAMIAYWSSQNGGEDLDWSSVNWETINWDAVNWNAVNWNAVNWNAVNWNAVNWNAVNWNAVNWNAVNWNAVNWNAVNWNAVNWNAVNWNAVSWEDK